MSADGALDRDGRAVPRATRRSAQYIAEMIFDLVVHAWDLGAAIGYPGSLPEDLVAFSWDQVQGWGDVSGSGYFAAPVSVPADAPTLDKLVAATGREPDWKAS